MLARCLRVPHLYDMHSSLPQQLSNFAFSQSRVLRRLFLALERFMIRGSRVVIVICPTLEDTVRAIDPDARVALIENAPGSADEGAASAPVAVRTTHGLAASAPVVLYTGTFEAYQGLDLLFDAMAHRPARAPGRAAAPGRREARSGRARTRGRAESRS